jgi:glycosyltransferase involved in cell wall biosynthesis
MRIAIASTVYKRTPPVGYGGIERVVHSLAEELVARGHKVTLFATPGSHCSGETVELHAYDPDLAPSGAAGRSGFLSEEALYEAMSARITPDEFDVVHDFSFSNLFVQRHPERMPFLVSSCLPPGRGQRPPNVVASCGRHAELFGPGAPFVRYGLDLNAWESRYEKQDHIVHIAKIAPYKGQHEAVLAATLARRELRLIGNVEHEAYANFVVKPLLKISPKSRYFGETDSTRRELLPAAALIQTPKWFDAFPMIVLEAMACGTPVIAYDSGGLAEQIEHGVNGFLCEGPLQLAQMISQVDKIDPKQCRKYAEEHFSVVRMADEYCKLYGEVIEGRSW